jgi:hypothetical protein
MATQCEQTQVTIDGKTYDVTYRLDDEGKVRLDTVFYDGDVSWDQDLADAIENSLRLHHHG